MQDGSNLVVTVVDRREGQSGWEYKVKNTNEQQVDRNGQPAASGAWLNESDLDTAQ